MKNTLRPLIFGFALAAASSSVLAGAYDDLIAAVYRDDTHAVMDLVNRGMDVNSVDPAGNTLLHVAARNGNDALIAALIKQKANPNARNRVGDTPLALAAFNGKKAAIDALLTAGAQVNSPGWTALHYAVFAEHPEIVAYLLGKGAQVDLRAPNQQTALMLAAKNGNIEIVRILLNAKADTRLKDQNDDTPLMLARQSNNSTVAQLLEQSAAAAEQPAAPAKVPEGEAGAK